MSSKTSPAVPLVLAAVASVLVALGISRLGTETRIASTVQTAVDLRPRWAATAQGRVEPKSGEIRLSALTPGRIEEVLVAVNDKVVAGDLLVRIDDADAFARIVAADSEAGVRKYERDSETDVPPLARERRDAEDRLNEAERALSAARIAFDRLQSQRHADAKSVTPEQIAAARTAVAQALARLPADREALRRASTAAGVPLPTRLEAGLTQSRADLTLAEAALERTRVKAPFDGTILQVLARAGELAAVTPEAPVLVIGDLSRLKVRAEVEERDASRIKVGQAVVLKTDAFPDKEFAGKVTTIAQAMRPPRLAHKGPRRPNDLDTLETVIDVDAGTLLMPGMRVDVYFRGTDAPAAPAGAPAQPAAPAKSQ